MKFLWIGSYASDDMLNRMSVKSIGQASGITSQRSFISGIDLNFSGTDKVLDTLSVQGIPPYPIYPSKIFKAEEWCRNQGSRDISIGFNNNKYLRGLSQKKGLAAEVKKWIKSIPLDEEVFVFLYEPVLSRLAAVENIKKIHKKTTCVLIVPDIPEYVGSKENKVINILKILRKKLVDKKLRYIDKYVFYAEKMAEYYHVPKYKYTVIEGSIDQRDADKLFENMENQEKLILLYSGAVTKERAIPQFLEAFKQYVDPQVLLWITGAGNYDESVNEFAMNDKRIKHFGFLNTREEVLEKESCASALLHIRDINAISSSYCFPSKLFEYLASGKPVLSVRIPGIPDEYYQYLIEIKELSIEGISDAINLVKSMTPSERTKFGERAREFVLREKSSKVQAGKLLDFAQGKGRE